MSKSGVAVIVEGSAAIEIQALRRALSDPSLPSIAPHVTLVPPLRLKDHDLPEAIRLLHRAAADFEPFTVTLGPPDTFAPVTSTVHLPVEDPAGSLGACCGRRCSGRRCTGSCNTASSGTSRCCPKRPTERFPACCRCCADTGRRWRCRGACAARPARSSRGGGRPWSTWISMGCASSVPVCWR